MTTARTERLWAEMTARLAHPAGQNLGGPRPRLCSTIGSHDARDGRCIDCGRTLRPGDPVCAERDGVL
jgi:hypothetical protein